MDLFDKLKNNLGPLGQYANFAHDYYTFPKLEGQLNSRMNFGGKEKIVWSINNYLGLGNHPEVRKVDEEAAKNWGLAYPMGSRMMSGNTSYHDQLENDLSDFLQKEDTILLNFGYQGIMSAVDCLVDRHDVIVYDADCHACIIDGVKMHLGKRFVFPHNDIEKCRKQLERAKKMIDPEKGSILVISEGVFGMKGTQGKLKEIVELKKEFNFRFLVDDAHGFGTLGKTGMGAGEEQGCHDEIDLYFSTFAKSMASVGAFISADKEIVKFLRYNMRSQIFAKSLANPVVIGNIKRLQMLRTMPQLKEKLWQNVNKLQSGLRENGFELGDTKSCVTPVYLQGSVADATGITLDLRENYNIFCSIVAYPVVPKGVILLRLIPTAAHTDEDIEITLKAFSAVKQKLANGDYKNTLDKIQKNIEENKPTLAL